MFYNKKTITPPPHCYSTMNKFENYSCDTRDLSVTLVSEVMSVQQSQPFITYQDINYVLDDVFEDALFNQDYHMLECLYEWGIITQIHIHKMLVCESCPIDELKVMRSFVRMGYIVTLKDIMCAMDSVSFHNYTDTDCIDYLLSLRTVDISRNECIARMIATECREIHFVKMMCKHGMFMSKSIIEDSFDFSIYSDDYYYEEPRERSYLRDQETKTERIHAYLSKYEEKFTERMTMMAQNRKSAMKRK